MLHSVKCRVHWTTRCGRSIKIVGWSYRYFVHCTTCLLQLINKYLALPKNISSHAMYATNTLEIVVLEIP